MASMKSNKEPKSTAKDSKSNDTHVRKIASIERRSKSYVTRITSFVIAVKSIRSYLRQVVTQRSYANSSSLTVSIKHRHRSAERRRRS